MNRCAALGWGFMSMIQAACHSYGAMMAARFLIGVFEAAFAPGVALFLSMFYHRHEMGLRYGLFISFSPLASCFASALAYGILQADTALMGWQLLFIVEGSPTILLAVIAAFILPNAPGQCRFLNKEENHIVAMRALKGRGADQEKKLNLKQVFSAFYDYKNYLQAAIIFCLNCAFGSLPAYMPTIIAQMGIGTKLEAQGLSAPPYLLAYFVCLAASFLSDKAQNRGFFILGFCCTGGVGYILLGVVHTTAVRYFATFLVCAGTFPAVALTFTWVTDNQGSASKRGAGLAIFGMVGQCGSILGARIFPTQEGPYYIKGMTICAAVLFFGAVLSQVLSFSLRMQNRSRDKKHGKGDVGSMPEDISDLGDDHPMYRYVL